MVSKSRSDIIEKFVDVQTKLLSGILYKYVYYLNFFF